MAVVEVVAAAVFVAVVEVEHVASVAAVVKHC